MLFVLKQHHLIDHCSGCGSKTREPPDISNKGEKRSHAKALRWLAILAAVLTILPNAYGQDVELVGLYLEETLPSGLKSFTGSMDEGGNRPAVENLEIGIRTTTAKAGFPLVFNEKRNILVSNLAYKELSIQYGGTDSSEGRYDADTFYTRKYSLTFIDRFSKESMLILMGSVSRSSDETAAASNSQKYAGGIIYNTGQGKELRYGGGLVLTYNFGEPLLLPVFLYRFSGQGLFVNAFFPNKLVVDYELGEKVKTGLELNIDGDQYRLTKAESRAEVIKYAQGVCGAYVLLGDRPGIQAKIGAGRTFLRRYEFSEGDRKLFELELENNVYYRASLKFAF
ncbi:MAG: hypothetical protein GY866_36640 [Proteobacteria bacterium]|nr:hypothetical protein [Pseudomonadota bacterium]